MMNKYIQYLLLILFLLYYPPLHADDDIYFYHLGVRDGLSQINIMSIYQDEFGAMWFGSTEGLNRYNGKDIEVFRPSKNQEGLSYNTIYSLDGNKNGAVYIRSATDLIRYDLYTQKFDRIKQGGVNAIKYKDGILWAVVGDKIMQYSEQEKELREYATLQKKNYTVMAMHCADDSTIWIGSNKGLVKISKNNVNDQTFVIKDMRINAIYEDNEHNIWVGTHNNGVFKISPSGEKTNYLHRDNGNSLSNNEVRSILEDKAGKIWIATFYGLNQFDPQTGKWKRYINNDNITHSISHSSVFSLYEDKQGSIWVGTYFGGVNYFNTDAGIFRFYSSNYRDTNYLSFPYIGNMTEDKHGNLWICTEGGALNCLNLTTRQFTRYMFSYNDFESVGSYNQKSIWYRPESDQLYIGLHNGGLAIFDIKTKKSRVLTHKSDNPYSLPNNTINKMQYHNNSLFILTQQGLARMDLATHNFLPVSDNPTIQSAAKGIGLYTFLIDSKDRLWVVTSGVRSINLKTGEIKNYTYDENNKKSIGRLGIIDIFESSTGDLYFGTLGSGIFKYNPQTEDFDNYTVEETGLSSNYCYNIAETRSGNLILLQNRNFSLLDPKDPQKKIFRSSDNFPISGFNMGNTSYITKDNEIFVGGVNGLVSFYENNLDMISKDYNLYFDKLLINNREVKPEGESQVLKQTLPLCTEINLKHSQSNFSIEFATSDYLQTMSRNYEYKLDGFDQEWMPARNKTISYTNLSGGKYTLQVREITPDGTGKMSSLIINIHPPFYLSTWAFVIYGLLIFFLIVALIRFYTWRTKLETTLEFERKDKERIEELNKTKLRFFTSISHEFRTPLTLIIGQVETLMMQNDLSNKVYTKISKIYKNANHLSNLITELLDFRKQEQGFYKLNIKHVELIGYIKNIYQSFEDYAEKRNIKYKLEYLDEQIYVYIDPIHLQKAIYNLLSNAFKYTSEGGEIRIRIKLQQSDVVIQVIDNGIGIPSESLNKIFERFYQLEYRSSGLTLGTGIGLALTQEIIQAHRGSIHVESTLNEGSIFSINLKLGTSHFSDGELNRAETADANPQVEVFIPEDEESSLHPDSELIVDDEKPNILLVDDNESLLDMLKDAFSTHYNVYTTTNGKDALEIIFKIQPDIVISDIMMPEMSGKELCYRIKNNVNTSHIPVVLLTAQTSDHQIIEGYMFGADAYITKPFNIKILITHCNNLIKNRRILYKKFAKLQQEEEQTAFNTVLEHDQVLIDKAISIIKENFSNPEFDMNKLGAELGMGRSKLYVKIKEITGFTPNELTLNLKLQDAANMLDNQPQKNISDIAFEVGFSSTKYFSKCFKTFYGMVPQDWRKRKKGV